VVLYWREFNPSPTGLPASIVIHFHGVRGYVPGQLHESSLRANPLYLRFRGFTSGSQPSTVPAPSINNQSPGLEFYTGAS